MLCKRAARRAHKAKIGFVRPAHIVISVVGVGVYALAYLLPKQVADVVINKICAIICREPIFTSIFVATRLTLKP